MKQQFIVYGRFPTTGKRRIVYAMGETPSGAAKKAENMQFRRFMFAYHARPENKPIPPRFALVVVEAGS